MGFIVTRVNVRPPVAPAVLVTPDKVIVVLPFDEDTPYVVGLTYPVILPFKDGFGSPIFTPAGKVSSGP